MKFFKICLLICFVTQLSYAQKKKYDYYDGPYITVKKDSISLRWIEDGKRVDSLIARSDAKIFERKGMPTVDLRTLDFDKDKTAHFENVDNWVAISDVHGQHDLFIKLLKAQGVIDQNEKWNFGKGHLVIIGDIFDRGDKVTESLWFVFELEKQAAAAGGKVHMLLGNHELMVMHADLRFLNPKYLYTQGVLRTPYAQLFDTKTVLGQWLRSKPVCLSLNESAFVHGGFSKQVLEKTKSLKKINKVFREKLYEKEPGKDVTPLQEVLYFDNGPLWYRGYAKPDEFDVAMADNILKLLDKTSIVVGHTTMPEIVSLHDDKIFLIDSSIKFGETGEMLVYENGAFMRGLLSGKKQPINSEAQARSPFQYMQQIGDKDLKLVIETDVKKLIAKKLKEEWQEAKITTLHNDVLNDEWQVKVRARGNVRKEVCTFPPLKIKLPETDLKNPVTDKLKLVLPCNKSKNAQQKLYKEFLIYKLYQLIDENALSVKLAQIELRDETESKYDLTGFLIEDNKAHADRKNVTNVEKGILSSGAFQRSHLIKFCLFQYMILNQDWSIANMHNIEVFKIPGEKKVSFIPYDFDYAGMVNQPYATPPKGLDLGSVRQKYFRAKKANKEEMLVAQQFFNTKKEGFLDVISNSPHLNEKNKKSMIDDINSFYEDLNDESAWKKYFYK